MDLQSMVTPVAVAVGVALVAGACFKLLHRRYVAPLEFPNKELAGDIQQTRVAMIDCGPDAAVLAGRDAVLSLPRAKRLRMADRKIEARTGISMRTFGEVIEVSVEATDSGKSRLTVESRPRFSGTTIDYGKSYENVERILAHLAIKHATSLVSASSGS